MIKYAAIEEQRILADKGNLKKRLGGVLGRNVDRLKKARETEFEKDLQALATEAESENEHLKELHDLITTEADLEPWIRDSIFLQMLKTKF